MTIRCVCAICRAHDELLVRKAEEGGLKIPPYKEEVTAGRTESKGFVAKHLDTSPGKFPGEDRVFIAIFDAYYVGDGWKLVAARPTGRSFDNKPEVVVHLRWKGNVR